MPENKSQSTPEKRVIAVTGPTASGKSSLALRLAERFGGEIISCDSMQIYRGMDIGTAKDPPEERALIPHHLIDVADPGDSFSCSDYAALASKAADDVIARGKLPVFCGGTGLYLDSVLASDRFPETQTPPSLRQALETKGDDELRGMLLGCDSVSFRTSDIKNRRRLTRALEIFYTTGLPKSRWDELSRTLPPRYKALRLAVVWQDRDELYKRIDSRVDEMFARGLAGEAEGLYRTRLSDTARQAIGYKEIFDRLDRGEDPMSAMDDVKRATRRYAKRQLTWLRRGGSAVVLEGSDPRIFEKACAAVSRFIGKEQM